MRGKPVTKLERTRLTITWSSETDRALRSHLRSQRLQRGALSRFIEDAVKWSVFNHTVSHARDAFETIPADELSKMIDDAVTSVRRTIRRDRRSE
jgi:hypothetical protein